MTKDLVIYKYLDELIKRDGSDMYITCDAPVSVRNNQNQIIPVSKGLMKQANIDKLIDEILDEEEREEFESTLEFNCSITREDKSRFRFNLFKQQQHSGIVIRKINTEIPTIESLQLPDIYASSIMKKRGLIILASPAGSGKSTSMAAMIGHRNKFGAGHILTIEDPIEYVHEHDSCIITQREVGIDTFSYGMALKNALRQRADLIGIGEIRDRESMEHALKFSETGHLCIATLHSNNSAQAIDRIVNLFPDDSRSYILATLSQNLLSIFSQRLMPGLNKSNAMAVEILLNEGLIRQLIIDDKITEIREVVERGRNVGMQVFDQSIYDLYTKKEISMETALNEAENPSALRMKISRDGFEG